MTGEPAAESFWHPSERREIRLWGRKQPIKQRERQPDQPVSSGGSKRRAKQDGISVNQFVATAVAEKLAAMSTAEFSVFRICLPQRLARGHQNFSFDRAGLAAMIR